MTKVQKLMVSNSCMVFHAKCASYKRCLIYSFSLFFVIYKIYKQLFISSHHQLVPLPRDSVMRVKTSKCGF